MGRSRRRNKQTQPLWGTASSSRGIIFINNKLLKGFLSNISKQKHFPNLAMNPVSVMTLQQPKRVRDMTLEEYNLFRRDYMRAWRDNNREHFREKCRIHSKTWYNNHKEEVLAEKRRKRHLNDTLEIPPVGG